jgi:hypothetical protein
MKMKSAYRNFKALLKGQIFWLLKIKRDLGMPKG